LRARREDSVSEEAAALLAACDVVDLHVDSFIWTRAFGYDLRRDHGHWWPLDYLGHADLPRLRAGGVTGAYWSVTTNPFRRASHRLRKWQSNARHLLETLPESLGVRWIRNAREYRDARARGEFAAMLAIQGGNCLEAAKLDDPLPEELLRVTLVHMTRSALGGCSAPFGGDDGLGALGRSWVDRLDDERIFIDLAHAAPNTFWDVMKVPGPRPPRLVSHTGVAGIHRHWRNIDDTQLAAIADNGGCVGVVFHSGYLRAGWRAEVADVVDHLLHISDIAGEDCPALGTDWDGAVRPPKGLGSPGGLVKVVEELLRRRISSERIRKILCENAERTLARLRP